MFDLFLIDDVVMMQLAFYIMLFLSVLTTTIYMFNVKNRKIQFMVLGNVAYLFLHVSVLLSINGLIKLPFLVGTFDLLSVTFYMFAVFKLFEINFNKIRYLIINLIHIALLVYFIVIVDQVSVLRLVTTLFVLITIVDGVLIVKSQKGLVPINSLTNLILNTIFFFIYKLLLFINRIYTMSIEVGIDSIVVSINAFTFVGILFVLWINFTIMFINYDILNSQYKHLSLHDYLTDLPNRRYAVMRIKEAMIESKTHKTIYGLIYLDIDGFKQYNDEFGHDFGDEVLVEFSTKFKTLIRSNDMFARYGGDEFIVLLQVKEKEEMTYFINRVTSYFERTKITSKALDISLSLGKGYIDETSTNDVQQLLDEIDRDLYNNKRK